MKGTLKSWPGGRHQEQGCGWKSELSASHELRVVHLGEKGW